MIIGSNNRHKIKEIQDILSDFGFQCISLSDFGITNFEVVEDADTFEGNCLKKVKAVHKKTGLITIADDSGLMVDALAGAPGVFSARYAGEECDDHKNNLKLLEELKNKEKRRAKFVSVISMLFPSGKLITVRGECPGVIIGDFQGESGFGYDPLFMPDGFEETFAQMSSFQKNKVSHRSIALKKLREKLKEYEV